MGDSSTNDVRVLTKIPSLPSGEPGPSTGVCAQLWAESKDLAYQSLMHPFVLGIAHGTLPRAAFRHFIGQDATFLLGFAEGYAAAMARCSPSQQHLAEELKGMLHGVRAELRLHESYAGQWGVLLEHQRPSPATKAYLYFIKMVSEQHDTSLADIMSALIPCLRLYGWLGRQLALMGGPEDNPYADWINTYTSEAYSSMPSIAEAILDEAYQPGTYDRLLSQYRTAMQLEQEFFAAQPMDFKPRQLNLLVIDFDETITTVDTTGMIAQAAIKAVVAKVSDPAEAAQLTQELTDKLSSLSRNYASRRASLLTDALPVPNEGVKEEFDMGWLGDFIARVADFDREMNGVVIESGILKGVRREQLAQAGAKVESQPGSMAVMQKALEAGIPVAVVSVSWSAEFVRAALAQQGLPVVVSNADGPGADSPVPGAITIYANELEFYGEESTGNIRRRCECGADKGRFFDDMLLGLAAEAGSSGDTVYIGDSMTDVPPLISADMGVLVGNNPLVRQLAACAGMRVAPLTAAPLGHDPGADAAAGPVLFEASSWAEIDAFLFGGRYAPPPARGTAPPARGAPLAAPGGAVPRLLVVAGTDSAGGAGVLADVKTCVAAGVHASVAITAVTAQNSLGVQAIHTLPVDFVLRQMKSVLDDLGADVVKTGMMPTAEVVHGVAGVLRAAAPPPLLVVDPVLVSTTGDALAQPGVVEAMRSALFPLATLITPNLPEAAALLGDGRVIVDVAGMRAAARDLHALGPAWVLVKGGHLAAQARQRAAEGEDGPGLDDESPTDVITDVLYDGRTMLDLSEPLVVSDNVHGTGCSLASAIAAELARGQGMLAAVRAAKRYLWRTLERSRGLPLGTGPQRIMNFGWKTADWAAELASTGQDMPLRVPNAADLRLYAVTDPACNDRAGRSLVDAVRLAIDGGATLIQVREKDADAATFAAEAGAALEHCRGRGVPLIINDRLDIALALDADGVHVGQSDLPAGVARRLLGPDKILGVSVKTPEQALRAQADGADYVGCGGFAPTTTKAGNLEIGGAGVRAVVQAVTIPVVAIGGISEANASAALRTGAAGVAVVSAIFGAEDPVRATKRIRAVVDAALAARGLE